MNNRRLGNEINAIEAREVQGLEADLKRAEAEASRLGGVEGLYMEAADRATVAEAQLARISSLVRVLYPQEMTPTAKRMLDQILGGELT